MKWTGRAWGAAILLLLVYEAYAVMNACPGDTLSEWVWLYGQHPMVSFAAGVLVGHLWWQRRSHDPK